jgi:hypothetical protein
MTHEAMKHVSRIEILIETLVKSDIFHALVVQSPPGWSKSTTIDAALKKLQIPFISVGSYTTALHFFNTLVTHPSKVILLDDSAGLFSDAKTMAILKAATWASSGGGVSDAGHSLVRRVTWGSTSEKVLAPEVDFQGKVILLTNVLPHGKETQAFLSRCLSYRIAFSDVEIKNMILEAAASPEHFERLDLAADVARFIVAESQLIDFSQVNLRTLRMGYELARTQPECWQDVFTHLLPRKSGDELAYASAELINPRLPPKLQEAEFCSRTGKGRRTFFLYKKRLGLSRPYHSKKQKEEKAHG